LLEVQIELTLVGFFLLIFDQRTVFSYLVNVEEGEPSIYQMNTFVALCISSNVLVLPSILATLKVFVIILSLPLLLSLVVDVGN
jgi:hypothetical protein